jgi:hypothetical protein
MELFNEKTEGLKGAYLRDFDALKDLRISPFSLIFAPIISHINQWNSAKMRKQNSPSASCIQTITEKASPLCYWSGASSVPTSSRPRSGSRARPKQYRRMRRMDGRLKRDTRLIWGSMVARGFIVERGW